MQLVPYCGPRELVGTGQGVLLSEEFALLTLPILALTRLGIRDVIFIERGAYPFKCALDLLQERCPDLPKMNSYAYKIASGNSANPANQDLANSLVSFFRAHFPEKSRQPAPPDLTDHLPKTLENPTTKSIIEIVAELVASEPSNYIDDVKQVNRLFKKMCHSKISPKEFRVEIEKLSSDCAKKLIPILEQFPKVIETKRGPYLTAIMLHMNQFLIDQYQSHQFRHAEFYAAAFKTLNLPFDRFLIVDESSGSGLSAHLSYLFHKIVTGTSLPCFLTVTASEAQTKLGDLFKPNFQFGAILPTNPLPEDNPDMFAAIYDNGNRVPYATTPPPPKSAAFLDLEKWAEEVLEANRNIKEKAEAAISARRRTQNPIDRLAIALFLAAQTRKDIPPIVETSIELVGHNRLVAMLENTPAELTPLPDSVQTSFRSTMTEVIHHLSYRLYQEHLEFLRRAAIGLEFFTDQQAQIEAAFSQIEFGLNTFQNTPELLTLAHQFYDHLDQQLQSGVNPPLGH